MRKLAREVVIFMLLTPLVVIIGSFAYLYHDAHKPVLFDMSKAQPITNAVPKPPFDPNAPYAPLDLSAGLVPKPTSELMLSALLFGLYGIPMGFGLWVLYRLVYFAMKG